MAGGRDRASEAAVVPLSQLPAGALDRLFASERREWLSRLDWDLADVHRLIAGAVRARTVRGVAVTAGGDPVGFAFYSTEPERCLVGDLFVRPGARSRDVNAALAEGLLRQIRRARPRLRVENQAVCLDERGVGEVFADHGFRRYERLYMAVEPAGGPPPAHERVELRSWREADFGGAVEAVFQSYRGTVDAEINAQYRTREGCADLLDALTGTAWCGRLMPEVTRVAVDRGNGRVVGVALASRISATAVHLGQISVHPRRQGRGVGEALVRGALAAAAAAGLSRVTLAVTRENARAARLYERSGFRPRVAFAVYARDPAPLSAAP